MDSLAAFTTASVVMPNSRYRTSYSALAPKCSIEMLRPWCPTYCFQESEMPASTETRAATASGSTCSLYSASCSSNHSRLGALTTRAWTPSAARASRASTANWTSEPVAMRITSGVPSVSARM